MGFQEKRQGTSGWTHPFWLLNFIFIALHTAQARIPEVMMDAKPAWFMETEGQRVVENVLSWQTSAGSWPKNVDTASEPFQGSLSELRGTFDNAPQKMAPYRALRRQVKSPIAAFLKALQFSRGSIPIGDGRRPFRLRRYSSHIPFNKTMVSQVAAWVVVGIFEPGKRDHQGCQGLWQDRMGTRSQIKVERLTVWCVNDQ